MPGLPDRYNDSITSSDAHYTNPYRNDADYARAERLRTEKMRQIDQIESSQTKLERELLEQFRENKFQLPLGNFLIIGQIGKFIFFAVMLPPYILLYGLPKKLFQKTAPLLAAGFSQGAQFFGKMLHNLNSFQQGLFNLFEQNIKALLLRKKIKSTKDAKPSEKRFSKQIKDAWSAVFLRISHLTRIAKALHSFTLRKFSQLKQFSQSAFSLLKVPQQAMGNQLRKLALALSKVKGKLSEWNKPIKLIREKTKERWERFSRNSYKHLQKSYEAAKNAAASGAHFVAKPLETISTYAWQFVLFTTKPIVSLAPHASRSASVLKAAMASSSQWIKKVAHDGFSVASSYFKQAINHLNKRIAAFQEKAANAIRRFAKAQVSRIKAFLSPFKKAIQKIKERGGEGFKKAKNRIKRAKDELSKKAKDWLIKALHQAKNLPGKLKNLALFMLRKLISFFRSVRFALQFLYAWIRILFRFGMQSIRETMRF